VWQAFTGESGDLVRRWLRRFALLALVLGLLGTTAVYASAGWIYAESKGHLYDEASVPPAPVALVLGAKVEADGQPSAFLAARLALAQRLLETGKVRVILVSGDNMNVGYDEPEAMRRWLLAQGVPTEKIVLDYAGFDTYDSCARAVRIFGVTEAIVVTQSYHVARAVAICRRIGIAATGVGDDTVRQYTGPWRSSATRELGAWVKASVDVLAGRDPVHLGPHETGVEDALRTG
jgi:vancomycin permeability regulator SanA